MIFARLFPVMPRLTAKQEEVAICKSIVRPGPYCNVTNSMYIGNYINLVSLTLEAVVLMSGQRPEYTGHSKAYTPTANSPQMLQWSAGQSNSTLHHQRVFKGSE